MAVQTQALHKMAQAMEEINQAMAEQAALLGNYNTSNKRSHGVPELERRPSHEDTRIPEGCARCEHHGLPCPRVGASLMATEALQRYHSDIHRASAGRSVRRRVPQAQGSTPTMDLEGWSITVTEFQPRRGGGSKKQANERSQGKELPEPWVAGDICPNPIQTHGFLDQHPKHPEDVRPPPRSYLEMNPGVHATPLAWNAVQEASRDEAYEETTSQCYIRNGTGNQSGRRPSKKKRGRNKFQPYPSDYETIVAPAGQWPMPPEFAATITCYRCGERGHIAAKCPTKTGSAVTHDSGSGSMNAAEARRCYRCGAEGHYAHACQVTGLSDNK